MPRRTPFLRMCIPGWLALGAAGLDTVAPCPAAVTTATVAALPDFLLSRTRRFSAQGSDPRIAVPLLDWTEDIAGRLERVFGAPLPCPQGTSFRLIISEAAAGNGGPALKRELAIGEAGVSVRLHVFSAANPDPAALLDALVSLMLARHVIARQPEASWRRQPRDAPDWFSCGLAASLYPGPRARAHRDALNLWRAGRETTPPQVLRTAPLPDGAQDDRAMAAAFVGWLRSRQDFPRIAHECLQAWAGGGTMDASCIARLVQPAWTSRDLRQEWDLWLGGLRQFEAPWALSEPELLLRCREALSLPRELVPVELPADVPEILDPETLVGRRLEPWTTVASLRMIANLDRIPCGQHPAAGRIVTAFRTSLATLSRPVLQFPLNLFDGRPGSATLLRRLTAARNALDDLESVAAARVDTATEEAARAAQVRPGDAERTLESRLGSAALREIFRDSAAPPPSPRR